MIQSLRVPRLQTGILEVLGADGVKLVMATLSKTAIR